MLGPAAPGVPGGGWACRGNVCWGRRPVTGHPDFCAAPRCNVCPASTPTAWNRSRTGPTGAAASPWSRNPTAPVRPGGRGRRRSPRCGRRSWTPWPPPSRRRTACRMTGPRASGGTTRWPTPPPASCGPPPCRPRAGHRSPCWPPPPSPTSPPPPRPAGWRCSGTGRSSRPSSYWRWRARPRSSRWSSPTPAGSSPTAPAAGWPPAVNASPSPRGTAAAPSPAAIAPRPGPRSITSPSGSRAARQTSTTSAWSAASTTAPSRNSGGRSTSRTASRSGPHRPGSTPTRDRDATPPTTDPTSSSDNPPRPPDRRPGKRGSAAASAWHSACVSSVWPALGHALGITFSMTWQVTWSLILGFTLSAVIEALVRKSTIASLLPDDRARSVATATALGAASSSCSYAAVAMARSLIRKGADFTASMAFQFASTNLVIELGLILALLLGWQFTLAEFVGGPFMILLLALLFRRLLTHRLRADAREQADEGLAGSMEGHAAMDMSVRGSGSFWRRLASPQGVTSVSHNFVMEWAAVIRDIVVGLLIAGAAAAWIPDSFWPSLFFTGHPLAAKVWGPLIGPIVAVLAFVCSIGNVPLAAVLWNGGISFGGVVSFIFADLIIIPIIVIYAKYYGRRVAAFLAATFYVTMVVAGYFVELVFAPLHLIPTGPRQAKVGDNGISWNYTTWLNIAFLLLAAGLVWRFLATGGRAMLAMMGGAPDAFSARREHGGRDEQAGHTEHG